MIGTVETNGCFGEKGMGQESSIRENSTYAATEVIGLKFTYFN